MLNAKGNKEGGYLVVNEEGYRKRDIGRKGGESSWVSVEMGRVE